MRAGVWTRKSKASSGPLKNVMAMIARFNILNPPKTPKWRSGRRIARPYCPIKMRPLQQQTASCNGTQHTNVSDTKLIRFGKLSKLVAGGPYFDRAGQFNRSSQNQVSWQ